MPKWSDDLWNEGHEVGFEAGVNFAKRFIATRLDVDYGGEIDVTVDSIIDVIRNMSIPTIEPLDAG